MSKTGKRMENLSGLDCGGEESGPGRTPSHSTLGLRAERDEREERWEPFNSPDNGCWRGVLVLDTEKRLLTKQPSRTL